MMDRIKTIIDKEWAEVFKNRLVLFMMIFLPLIFTILPLVILYFTSHSAPSGGTSDLPAMFQAICAKGMSDFDCMQVFVVNEFLIFYMLMPIIIPITIAAYSIVGEKNTRSLEPLLATPISTEELLAGKSLAAAIPAIGATWLCYLIFVLLLPVVGVSAAVRAYITGPIWLLAVFLAGPLMAILAVNFAIMISSRVSDPRVAEQVSVVLVIPILGLLFSQLAGIMVLNAFIMLILCLVIAAIDVGMIYLGARLFRRETILTKWR
jgi:ABC-2 type transport system permease protein